MAQERPWGRDFGTKVLRRAALSALMLVVTALLVGACDSSTVPPSALDSGLLPSDSPLTIPSATRAPTATGSPAAATGSVPAASSSTPARSSAAASASPQPPSADQVQVIATSVEPSLDGRAVVA